MFGSNKEKLPIGYGHPSILAEKPSAHIDEIRIYIDSAPKIEERDSDIFRKKLYRSLSHNDHKPPASYGALFNGDPSWSKEYLASVCSTIPGIIKIIPSNIPPGSVTGFIADMLTDEHHQAFLNALEEDPVKQREFEAIAKEQAFFAEKIGTKDIRVLTTCCFLAALVNAGAVSETDARGKLYTISKDHRFDIDESEIETILEKSIAAYPLIYKLTSSKKCQDIELQSDEASNPFKLEIGGLKQSAPDIKTLKRDLSSPEMQGFNMHPGGHHLSVCFTNQDHQLAFWDAIKNLPGIEEVKQEARSEETPIYHNSSILMDYTDPVNVKQYCELFPDKAKDIRSEALRQKNTLKNLEIDDLRLMATSLIVAGLHRENALTEETAIKLINETAKPIKLINETAKQIEIPMDHFDPKRLFDKAKLVLDTNNLRATNTHSRG